MTPESQWRPLRCPGRVFRGRPPIICSHPHTTPMESGTRLWIRRGHWYVHSRTQTSHVSRQWTTRRLPGQSNSAWSLDIYSSSWCPTWVPFKHDHCFKCLGVWCDTTTSADETQLAFITKALHTIIRKVHRSAVPRHLFLECFGEQRLPKLFTTGVSPNGPWTTPSGWTSSLPGSTIGFPRR